MALKPEHALTVGAVTAGLVYGIFQVELPSMADVHAAPANNAHISQSVNVAGWSAAVAVAGISLLAKDPTVFVIGGAMAAFLTWRAKHASMTSPVTGQVTPPQQVPTPAPAQGS
jgi:hypothetical protein